MAIEDEFHNAIRYRAELLLELARDAVFHLDFHPTGHHYYDRRPGSDVRDLAGMGNLEFMAQVVGCIQSEGALERLIDAHAYRQDTIANMDY